MPGIALRLPLLFSEGVRGGRITLNQFVALGSTNAAKLYGMHPQKGTIVVGADADVAIWDPEATCAVTVVDQHDNVDCTPFKGWQVTGWPVTVPSRGEAVTDGLAEALAPFRGTAEIDSVTLTEGPFGIEGQRHVDQVALPLAALIEGWVDAAVFVIACYSDPGIDLCRAAAKVPVFGNQESGVLAVLNRLVIDLTQAAVATAVGTVLA